MVKGVDLNSWVARQPQGPWTAFLQEAVSDYAIETGGSEVPVDHFVEWLAEWGREARRRQSGLLLRTAHRAKGLEFDHVVVLDGGWDRVGQGEDTDAPRRLYYVAMTRARQTLTLATLSGPHPTLGDLTERPSVLRRRSPVDMPSPAPELARRYRRLGLRDVFLSFAGYRSPEHAVHHAIAALLQGDSLRVSVESDAGNSSTRKGLSWGCLRVGSSLRRTCIASRHSLRYRYLGQRAFGARVPGWPPLRWLGSGGSRAHLRTRPVAHRTAPHGLPLIMLLGQDCAAEAPDRCAVGKMSTMSARRLNSLLSRSCGLLDQTCSLVERGAGPCTAGWS